MFESLAFSAFSLARLSIPSWMSMATTPPSRTRSANGMATLPGPQPTSSTTMSGSSSKCSIIVAARFVRVNGLSSSTNQRNQTGQGSERRLDAKRHVNPASKNSPTAPKRMRTPLITRRLQEHTCLGGGGRRPHRTLSIPTTSHGRIRRLANEACVLPFG